MSCQLCLMTCLVLLCAFLVDKLEAQVESRDLCLVQHQSAACERFEQSLDANADSLDDLNQLYEITTRTEVLGTRSQTSLLRKLVSLQPENQDYKLKLAFALDGDDVWESIELARHVMGSNPDNSAAYLAFITFLKELTPTRLNTERLRALRDYSSLVLQDGVNSSPPTLISYFNVQAELVELLTALSLPEEVTRERKGTTDIEKIAIWDNWQKKLIGDENLHLIPELDAYIWENCNPSLIEFDQGAHCVRFVQALSGHFAQLKFARPDIYSQLLYIKKLAEKELGGDSKLAGLLSSVT